MKQLLTFLLIAIGLNTFAQTTPTIKTRSDDTFQQQDNYLIALKRLGIPTGPTDNLVGSTTGSNSVKLFYNTTLNKLRVYNPVSLTWSDALPNGNPFNQDLNTTNSPTFSSVTATSFFGTAQAAAKLATARTIQGVSFDGTANINIFNQNLNTTNNATFNGLTVNGNTVFNGGEVEVVNDFIASDIFSSGFHFQSSGGFNSNFVSTATTTRTVTIPNKTFTIAGLDDAVINLTTLGTTGASTWNSSTRTLNIPNYTGGGGGGTGPLQDVLVAGNNANISIELLDAGNEFSINPGNDYYAGLKLDEMYLRNDADGQSIKANYTNGFTFSDDNNGFAQMMPGYLQISNNPGDNFTTNGKTGQFYSAGNDKSFSIDLTGSSPYAYIGDPDNKTQLTALAVIVKNDEYFGVLKANTLEFSNDGLSNSTKLRWQTASQTSSTNYTIDIPVTGNGTLALTSDFGSGKTIAANTTGSATKWAGFEFQNTTAFTPDGFAIYNNANGKFSFRSPSDVKGDLATTLQEVTNIGSTTTKPMTFSGSTNADWQTTIINNGTTSAHGLYVNIGASSTGIPFRVDKNGSPLFTIQNDGDIKVANTLLTNGLNSYSGDFFINYSGGSGTTVLGRNGAFTIGASNNTTTIGTSTSGNAKIGNWSASPDYVRFGHSSWDGGTYFGFMQQSNGTIHLNGLNANITGDAEVHINGTNNIDITTPILNLNSETYINDAAYFAQDVLLLAGPANGTLGNYETLVRNTTTGRIEKIVSDANVVSTSSSLTLVAPGYYTNATVGSTIPTWTIPVVSGYTGKRYIIFNAGGDQIDFQTASGGNDIWQNGSLLSTIALNAGESCMFYNDGVKWRMTYLLSNM